MHDVRLKIVIERLLARTFARRDAPWLLKGGFAMELRYRPQARTTKDLDLSVPGAPGGQRADRDAIRTQIQEAADIDLGDHLSFRIGAAKGELPGAPLGGGAFPVVAMLAGKEYARFHIDVGVGDAVFGEPEVLIGEDSLAFAQIAPARVLAIPKAQQFAEKIHAYTHQWTDRTNTRTKDLVDLVLFIERGDLDAAAVKAALRATFATRRSHPLPSSLDFPPEQWRTEFLAMAEQTGLTARTIDAAFGTLAHFWATNGLGAK